MSEVDRRFHETWLGMVQPVDGLVVSIPVLVDAQCVERQPPQVQQTLLDLCPATVEGETGPEGNTIADLGAFLSSLLGLVPELFDVGEALPPTLSLYVPEGKQTLRATMGLRKQGATAGGSADETPASSAGSAYDMLVWDLPVGLDLDKPEVVTGSWAYPPSAKMDRLLRQCRVPIGLLTNRQVVRLVYAPHGESSGSITFRLEDMASVGGRPILDAFVMLLSANRFFGVTEERSLPALLAESRKRQANVTNDLADQVFEALQILLRGFEAAAERDGRIILDDAVEREHDHMYKGLLTVLLRIVILLYAEDRGLLPTDERVYAEHLSVLGLFEQLQADRGAYPDSMSRRFGAWGRLVTLFRAMYLGLEHGGLSMPPRRGSLFNPHEYPFLEGWGPAGSAPITQPEARAEVRLPTVDDETVFRVLEKLLVLDGQRLSYRALDVEQIGSVYEALMGYHVLRMPYEAVCTKADRLWISAEEVLEIPAARRAKWLKETIGLDSAQSEKFNEELASAKNKAVVLEALAKFAAGSQKANASFSKARAGQLVLQPGTERRRTSSHYTPRSLSAPIVRRTLEPLIAAMGEEPPSEQLLHLKVCDPAMGSGAFLVEACRFLADHVLAAWTREKKVEAIAAEHGHPLLHARRLVAQRCLYGVDKNEAAVELAKLSLWLVTLSKTLPFTFLDHSLRHGDSLVGLNFDQIRAFHWKRPEGENSAPRQLELFGREIAVALGEAISLRQKIGELGDSPADDREKERLFWDAQDALDRVRLVGDVIVGAFFAHEKDKAREAERGRRENLVRTWLLSGGPATDELVTMQRELRAKIPAFHWMAEFPEVFYADRPDPLDANRINRAAYMDAFVGNPPFLGQKDLSGALGVAYRDWLFSMHECSGGKTDIVAHFLRRAATLLGQHGVVGMIATDKVSQGDTRQSGLQYLIEHGFVIFDAVPSMKWPGEASVSIATVAMAVGNVASIAARNVRIRGIAARTIDSRLSDRAERADPVPLSCNLDLSFRGCELAGQGFVISESDRARLMAEEPRNAERILMYLGGEDVNSSPSQRSERYVIDFAQLSMDEATRWPMLLDRVKELVKPERDLTNREARRKNWWRFGETQPAMRAAVAHIPRCLVIARDPQHFCFSFQPTEGRLFNEKLYVFPLVEAQFLALLQSRVHILWATRLGRTTGNAGTPSYSNTRCFSTFPFPKPDPRTVIPALEDIGQRLYGFRARYMLDDNVGLTITYNRLKDPACDDARILELRKLHEEMDREVLEAYADGDPEGRWLEVELPPFCPISEDDKKNLEIFEDAVIDRLFALNAKRAEEEKLLGLGAAGKKSAKPAKKAGKLAKAKQEQGSLQLETDDDP